LAYGAAILAMIVVKSHGCMVTHATRPGHSVAIVFALLPVSKAIEQRGGGLNLDSASNLVDISR